GTQPQVSVPAGSGILARSRQRRVRSMGIRVRANMRMLRRATISVCDLARAAIRDRVPRKRKLSRDSLTNEFLSQDGGASVQRSPQVGKATKLRRQAIAT